MQTVVIHTQNLVDAVEFFEALGLRFSEEKHGGGATHFAHAGADGHVLEIYPLTQDWPHEGLHVIGAV